MNCVNLADFSRQYNIPSPGYKYRSACEILGVAHAVVLGEVALLGGLPGGAGQLLAEDPPGPVVVDDLDLDKFKF